MKDQFEDYTSGLTSPASEAFMVVPDDAVDLVNPTRAIFIGGAGNLTIQMISGETVTLTNVQPGAIYPLRIQRVLATGTTATDVVGLR